MVGEGDVGERRINCWRHLRNFSSKLAVLMMKNIA